MELSYEVEVGLEGVNYTTKYGHGTIIQGQEDEKTLMLVPKREDVFHNPMHSKFVRPFVNPGLLLTTPVLTNRPAKSQTKSRSITAGAISVRDVQLQHKKDAKREEKLRQSYGSRHSPRDNI